MAVRATEPRAGEPRAAPQVNPGSLTDIRQRVGWAMRDAWWLITHQNPIIWRAALVVVALGVLLYLLSFPVSGRIFPGVRAMGVALGGKSAADAEIVLAQAWSETASINLIVAGETVVSVSPAEMGFILDTPETAQAARQVGLRALPFGREVEPVVRVNELAAQNYLLDITDQVDVRPYNAGYEIRAGEVVGVPGRTGRMMDIPLTIEQMMRDANGIVARGRLELLMIPLQPDVRDPSPHVDAARALVAQTPQLTGYDPFSNRHYSWSIPPETFVTWLEAGNRSLTLRESAFMPYIEALNNSLNAEGDTERFVARDETLQSVRDGIIAGDTSIYLRVRHMPRQYTVVAGDTGHRIARRTGIPLFEITNANPGIEWNRLSIGQTINLPSRDVVMPQMPVPEKRIVVNLDTQMLVAFENNEEVFRWYISSGVRNAPTSPGIYQILNHDERAYGSSNTLCDSAGVVCGQWQMNWFMGIYEVVPGLVNGFHGAVLLPNGNYLGGGNVGAPYTFGCVMSSDDNARMLYEWADVGTIVEIISWEFPPQSDLGRLALGSM